MKEQYTIRRTDGFGGQYLGCMTGIAYCEYAGLEYVHTPFSEMVIYQSNLHVDQINTFVGIPAGKNFEHVERSEVISMLIFGSEDKGYFTDNVKKKIRDYYYSTPKPDIPSVDIAIHIRRGDVDSSNFERFTSNVTYQRIIAMLRQENPDYRIHIYSEGNLDDFLDLNGDGIEFHLNEDILITFHSMVKAKILVVARSAFSYAAGILNENEHIYYFNNFTHKPLPEWHVLSG